MTLGQAFDPRANGLNLVRLVLATSVIFWHAYPLTGRMIEPEPLRQLVSEVPVDGFFAISGFLITMSWMRRPEWRTYLAARALRILPGFYVCLVVTAAALAPLAMVLSSESVPPGYAAGAIDYVLRNSLLYITEYSIAGTPTVVPYPFAWNGSLWTLWWEFVCYLGVLALGITGLIRRPSLLVSAFTAFLLLSAALGWGYVDATWATNMARFGLMFMSGVLICIYRDRIPVHPALIAAAVAVVLVASLVPNYRVIAAAPLSYVLLTLSTFLRSPRVQLRNDVSYGMYIYAFPMQQLLAGTALVTWPPLVFGVASALMTIPLALGSWFLVEKPVQHLRKRPMLAHAA